MLGPHMLSMGADVEGMTTQTDRIRHLIIRSVWRRLLAALVVVLVVVVAAGSAPSRSLSFDRLAWYLVLAEALVGLWLASSYLTNPLGGRYLRRLQATGVSFTPTPPPADSVDRIKDLGLPPLVPAARISDADASFDVYSFPDSLTVVMVHTEDGSVTVVSQLVDGRLLVTSDLLIVPSERLIVNLHPGSTASGLVSAHRRLAGVLAKKGLGPVRASAAISVEVLRAETEGMVGLGPVAGAFCGFAGSSKPFRLLVSPSPREVLALGLSHRQKPPLTPRSQMRVRSTPTSSTSVTAPSPS